MDWLSKLFSSQPHWFINILIGSFIGLILPYFLKLISYIFRLFKKEYLTGKWYGYYYIAENGKVKFYSDENTIKKGFFNKLNIIARRVDVSTNKIIANYKGHIYREGGYFGNYLLIQLTKVETGEIIFYRYVYPQTHSTMTIGLWLALDYDGIVTVGAKVLSRVQLNEDDVKYILKKIQVNQELKTLRLLHMLEIENEAE